MNVHADVIDAHTHLPDNSSSDEMLKDLILQMDLTSVDVSVILPIAYDTSSTLNNFVADTVKKYPDRLIGLGSIHPKDERKALKEMERFPDLHLGGVKLHPLLQNFHLSTPEMDSIAEKAETLELPLFIHSYFPHNTAESEGLYRLTVNYPRTQFVLAHLGGPAFLDCYAYVERRRAGYDNVYFDLSSVAVIFRKSPYLSHIKWLIEQIGADRVMFGSNYPKYQLVEALSAFDELGLSFKESQQILGKTASNLLKL